MGTLEKLSILQQKKSALQAVDKDAASKKSNKKTARERLNMLFDNGSFVELSAFESAEERESVVIGYGTVEGRTVYAFSQDFDLDSGAISVFHAKKILRVMDLSLKNGAPLCCICDSASSYMQEGLYLLDAIGKILAKGASMSGVVPIISMILGQCVGAAAYLPAISDFVFMVDKKSSLIMNGASVTQAVAGVSDDQEKLGGSKTHAEKTGICGFLAADEEQCIASARALIDLLPSNNLEPSPVLPSDDDIRRGSDMLNSIVPDDDFVDYDMKEIIRAVVDDGNFFETHALYATSMITGLARLNGGTVGIIANQPIVSGGVITADAAKKAARFARICDAFNIPLVIFADSVGYDTCGTHNIAGDGAKLLSALAQSTVPIVTIIVRKAYGSGYLAMGSKCVGADIAYAYPTAQICVLPPETAANILYREDIAAASDPITQRVEYIEKFKDQDASPYNAASKGFVDDVIEPSQTRNKLITALMMLENKRIHQPPKKHGNYPM